MLSVPQLHRRCQMLPTLIGVLFDTPALGGRHHFCHGPRCSAPLSRARSPLRGSPHRGMQAIRMHGPKETRVHVQPILCRPSCSFILKVKRHWMSKLRKSQRESRKNDKKKWPYADCREKTNRDVCTFTNGMSSIFKAIREKQRKLGEILWQGSRVSRTRGLGRWRAGARSPCIRDTWIIS